MRQRRDLLSLANSSHLYSLLASDISLALGNSSNPDPPAGDFSFHERRLRERSARIRDLQPFTVYRIDLHACSEEIQKCSAAAFAFTRTQAAGTSTLSSFSRAAGHLLRGAHTTATSGFIYFNIYLLLTCDMLQ